MKNLLTGSAFAAPFLIAAAALAAGCAEGSGGQGGAAGEGGMGGATTTTTTTTTTSATTTASTSASTSATGSGGEMGAGGQGGAGGGGGGCVGDAEHPQEAEPNDVAAQANSLPAGAVGFQGSLLPLQDLDYFSVDVPIGGVSLIIAMSDGLGGCPADADATITVYDTANNVLGSATSTPGSCAVLTPVGNPSLAGLAVGTYYVRVEASQINVVPCYVLDVALVPPGCGDGVLQLGDGEQCDDANQAAGDGCSAMCLLEGSYVAEVEPNGTSAQATPIPAGSDGALGAIGVIGDQDYYAFEVTVPGSSARILVTDGQGGCPAGLDTLLYLFNPVGAQIASDDDDGADLCSIILPAQDPGATDLATGTYTVLVHDFGNNDAAPFYVLEIAVTPPGCGDGILQVGEACDDGNLINGDGCSDSCTPTCGDGILIGIEQCDDGNLINGDGCSAACTIEAICGDGLTQGGEQCDDGDGMTNDGCDAACNLEAPEIEPNGDATTATPKYPAFAFWTGSVSPLGDHDWFSFDVPQGATIALSTSGVGIPASCTFDTVIHLVSSSGIEIAADDDDGNGLCSEISAGLGDPVTSLPGGTYHVWVQRYGDAQTIPAYQVYLAIQ